MISAKAADVGSPNPKRRESPAAASRTRIVHSVSQSSVILLDGTLMLMAATIWPEVSWIGAATHRTSGVDSALSMAKPARRTSAS